MFPSWVPRALSWGTELGGGRWLGGLVVGCFLAFQGYSLLSSCSGFLSRGRCRLRLGGGSLFGSSDGWHGEKLRTLEENRTKFGVHSGYQEG